MSNAELLNSLTSNTSLPGLDVDTLIEKGFTAKYKEQLDSVEDAKEREELYNSLYESYVEANKPRLEEGIAEIKSVYATADVQVQSVIAQAQEVVTTAAVPPVIGTAAPNPLREVLEMKSKKEQLEALLATITDSLVRLILVANKIGYELPQPVQATIALLSKAKSVLNAIPTKLS